MITNAKLRKFSLLPSGKWQHWQVASGSWWAKNASNSSVEIAAKSVSISWANTTDRQREIGRDGQRDRQTEWDRHELQFNTRLSQQKQQADRELRSQQTIRYYPGQEPPSSMAQSAPGIVYGIKLHMLHIKLPHLWGATNRFDVNATRHIVVQVRIGWVRAAAGAGHRNGALFVQHFQMVCSFLLLL